MADVVELRTKFPVGEFVKEEMEARGWSADFLAYKMTEKEIGINRLTLDFLFDIQDDPNLALGQETANALGAAFGVDPQFFMNLDRAWRDSLKPTASAEQKGTVQ